MERERLRKRLSQTDITATGMGGIQHSLHFLVCCCVLCWIPSHVSTGRLSWQGVVTYPSLLLLITLIAVVTIGIQDGLMRISHSLLKSMVPNDI